jgi:cysteine synthase
MAIYNTILDTVGNTPMVKLQKLAPEGVNVYVKLEAFNPMGSVKDRMACAMIERAEQSGELQPGQTVIEATSGNTGIGLAMVCAQKGYPLIVIMAENFSIERRKLLRFLGAKVVLTPAAEKGTGMVRKAEELAETHGYYLCRQFENEANADIHTTTTAQEILNDFEHKTLDYWVSGFGTGGTLKGVSRGLKMANPDIKVAVAEPDNSQLLGSRIPQPKNLDGSISASHPNFRPHLMQGWSPDFISSLTEQCIAAGWVDEIIPVAGQDALDLSKALAQQEGIFAGTSSGATLAAALTIARRSPAGTNIVCMLPDTGERYLSTPLFAEISADMTSEEAGLSASTPGFQINPIAAKATNTANSANPANATGQVSTPTADKITSMVPVALDKDAVSFVNGIIQHQPVVMFALEWCEFCWSVRKLFSALNIDYKSIDLDSVAFQKNDQGAKIRAVLANQLGVPTIPQIFIGGQHIGGATDLFAILEDRSLFELLQQSNIAHLHKPTLKADSLLPNWLHSRKSA